MTTIPDTLIAETPRPVARLDRNPPHMRARYERLALVSHPGHLAELSPDDDTLVVSCNWLLWQKAVADGVHCVHYESGLTGDDPDGLMSDLYVRASDWVYVDGEDATVFRGVSLGRKLFKETALVIFDHCKLTQTLSSLIQKYQPREIVFFDYRTDHVFLDLGGRFETVCDVADAAGVTLIDRRGAPDQSDPNMAMASAYSATFLNGAASRVRPRDMALRALERGVEFLCGVRRRLGGRKRSALLLTTHLSSVPLLERFDGRGVYPMLLARHFPRKRDLRFLIKSILRGVQLIAWPDAPLSADDERRLADIRQRLADAWQEPAAGADAHVRHYLRTQVLENGRLRELAATVVAAERILDRHAPDRILTDGLQNATYTTFLELARDRGIDTAATWHGQYLNDMKLEVFGGDPRVAPLAKYCLTWGTAQEDWLKTTAAKTIPVRTGNAIAGQHFANGYGKARRGRALALQYAPLLQDLFAPQATQFSYFVDVVRMLNAAGYDDICFRLHPGHSKIGYYGEIAEFFGLTCELSDQGPFGSVLADAEFAIGPVTTGAMLEVLGSEKPYYPVLLAPHALNPAYLQGSPIYDSIEDLRQAIASDRPLQQRGLLNGFTSRDDVPDPAATVWRVLSGDLPAPSTPSH